MEGKFVKERICWPLWLGLLTLVSFTSLPLWNDGAHFLFRLYEHNTPYIDPFWNRWADVLIQLPAWISILTFGPGSLTMWIFKLSLMISGPLILMWWIKRLEGENEKSSAILSSYTLAWLMPIALLFPISTIVPTLIASTIILSLLLKQTKNQKDLIAFVFSHLIISFGHEVGLLVLLIVLIYAGMRFNKKLFNKVSGRFIFLLEFGLILAIIFFKRSTWIGKTKVITSTIDLSDLPNYPNVIFLLPIVSFIMIFFRPVFRNAIGGLLLFYIFSSVYILWGNSFYHMALLGRIMVLPLLILLFIVLFNYKKEIPQLGLQFWGTSFLVLFVLMTKAFFLWNDFNKRIAPYEAIEGCTVVKKADLSPWSIPEWSLPYLSIVKQNTYEPRYVLVAEEASLDGNCLRLGNSLIVGRGLAYNVENFTKKIRFDKYIKDEIQFPAKVPFTATFPLLRLYDGEYLEITDPKNSECLEIDLGVVSHSVLTITSAGKTIWSKFVTNDFVEKIKVPGQYPILLHLGLKPKHQVIQVNSIKACEN